MHAWLDGLQQKIANGIHPPESPLSSPSPVQQQEQDEQDVFGDVAQLHDTRGTQGNLVGSVWTEEEAREEQEQPGQAVAGFLDQNPDEQQEEDEEEGHEQEEEEGGFRGYPDNAQYSAYPYDKEEQDELYEDHGDFDPGYGVFPEEDNQAYVESDGDAYAGAYASGSEDEGEDEQQWQQQEEEEEERSESPTKQEDDGDESDGIEYIGQSNSPQPPQPAPQSQPQSQPQALPPFPLQTNLYPPLPDAPTPYADPGAPLATASPAVPPLGGGRALTVEQDAMQIDPSLLQDGYQIDTGFLQDLVHHVSQGMPPPPQEGDEENEEDEEVVYYEEEEEDEVEDEEEEEDGVYDEDFIMSGDEREQPRNVQQYSEEEEEEEDEEEEDELVDEPSCMYQTIPCHQTQKRC